MKLIEALKKLKDLARKAEDIRTLVKDNCARSSIETDRYENQGEKVAGWIQSHSDILKEISRLRVAIQRTNLATEVSIELGGKTVTKTIAEWILRRRELAALELRMWHGMTDRGLTEGFVKGPSGEPVELKIIRHYSPDTRDRMKDELQTEPGVIDSRLEVVNAITDLME